MSKIESKQKIKVYEIDGKEVSPNDDTKLVILSHGIWSRFVVVEMDGKRYAVVGEILRMAVKNALNVD